MSILKNIWHDINFIFRQFSDDRIMGTHYLLEFLMHFKTFNKWLIRKKFGSVGKNVDIRPHAHFGGTKAIFIGNNVSICYVC